MTTSTNIILKQGEDLGNLAFADELVTIVLCPLWGVLSDKVGTRPVAVAGVFLMGICLFVYTTATSIYPGLICLRLFFAVGASAAASMITAILSEISTFRVQPGKLVRNLVDRVSARIRGERFETEDAIDAPASSSGIPRTSAPYSDSNTPVHAPLLGETEVGGFRDDSDDSDVDEIAPSSAVEDGRDFVDIDDPGFLKAVEPGRRNGMSAALVGLFSGIGACFAVFVLLSLPLTLGKKYDPAKALKVTYYIVASIAVSVSGVLFFGLHKDRTKGVRFWLRGEVSEFDKAAHNIVDTEDSSYFALLKQGFAIALSEKHIALAYMGGFVARSTTVATVMFIPLVINVYFHKQGRCSGDLHDPTSELKNSCPKAYLISVIVTGICQTAALLLAPFWGFTTDRFGRKTTLLCSSVIGFVGFLGFGCMSDPTGSAAVYIFGAMMGVAQIGTIIASMSLCTDTKRNSSGAIAGVYSFCGGMGILVLSKLGGWLSDFWPGAPFLMLAFFYIALIVMTISQMPEHTNKILHLLNLRSSGNIRLDEF